MSDSRSVHQVYHLVGVRFTVCAPGVPSCWCQIHGLCTRCTIVLVSDSWSLRQVYPSYWCQSHGLCARCTYRVGVMVSEPGVTHLGGVRYVVPWSASFSPALWVSCQSLHGGVRFMVLWSASFSPALWVSCQSLHGGVRFMVLWSASFSPALWVSCQSLHGGAGSRFPVHLHLHFQLSSSAGR